MATSSSVSQPSSDPVLHSLEVTEPQSPEAEALGTTPPDPGALRLEARSRGVTPRVVCVSLAIAVFFAWAIPVIDYKFFNTFLGATHLAPGAIGVLLIFILVVNPLLKMLSGRLAFSRNEVLTVYLTCLFSCLVPGIGGNNYFVSFMIGAFYYATPENKWLDVLRYLPSWMTPALNADGSYNRELVEGWFVGLRAGESIPWNAWLLPLLAWGSFALASFCLLGCLGAMLRAQWGEREALAFPLLRLPLELTQDLEDRSTLERTRRSILRKPLMWMGFAVAVVIQAMNGLNLYFPDTPRVPLDIPTGPLFTEAPWNQMGNFPMRVWPVAIGMSYLLTAEVGFSLWFFFLFIKLQLVMAYYLGFPAGSLPEAAESGGKIFTVFQDAGAHIAYVGLLVWIGREHVKKILRRAFGRARADDAERGEVLSYPVAFWGFALSFGYMVVWSTFAGMTLLAAVVLWSSYLVIAIIIARVVVEGGLIFVHHTWMPMGVWSQITGSGPGTWLSMSNGAAAVGVLEAGFVQDYRASLLPSFVQSFKLAHDRGIAGRRLGLLIVAVILVSLTIALHMNVRLGYENSGLQLQGWLQKAGPQMTGRNAYALARGVENASWWHLVWLLLGAAITISIVAMRSRFMWFTLHPLGYLVSQTYPMHTLWFSILIGWSCKVALTRYGGHETYRKTTPLFLGLALGDISMMLFWIAIDGWQGRTGHQLMPG
ncbi:MAG: hypothetical protein JWN98_1788 [Abditibacteriota bacterium]|nr:hypothetical protein [Abditibacteriota bacterium]